jgi:hypothetical protein
LIEFLPPREGAFGSAEGVDFVGFDGDNDTGFDDEPPRSRWLTGLAVVGVTALLAGGVIAAAPWDGDETASPPTTTGPAPTTTAPRAQTTSVAPDQTLPEDFVTDPPGMLLAGSSSFVLAGAQSDQRYPGVGDPIEVWMSPDATRTNGRWVVIDSREQMGGFEVLRRDAVRIDVGGGRRALMTIASDGVIELEVPPTDGAGFAITSFGLDLAAITGIAATVTVDARGIEHGDLLPAGGPFDGLDLRIPADVDFYPYDSVTGPPDAWSYFVDPATGEGVQVTVDRPSPLERLLVELVIAIPVAVADLEPDELAGLAMLSTEVGAEVGAPLDEGGLTLATNAVEPGLWAIRYPLPGDRVVTITSAVELADLLEISAQLELATPDAWRKASIETMNGPGVEPEYVTSTVIGYGGAGMERWTAQIDQIWFSIGGPAYGFSSPFEPVSGPTLTAYRSLEQAFLLATNTWPNDGLRIVVAQPGLEPQQLDLRQVGDTPVYAVVAEIDGDLPVTISWSDLDGVPVEGPTTASP